MSALAYVVVALASYRLARALAVDTISLTFRDRVYAWAWDDEHPTEVDGNSVPTERAAWRTYVFALVSCPVCIGFWCAAALYSAWRYWDVEAVRVVIAIFAVAGLQCFLATREGA